MKKQFIFICLIFLISVSGISQSESRIDTVNGRLMHLKYQRMFAPKYVNFDVIKIMVSRGSSLMGGNDYGLGPSVNFQFLNPWPFFKTTFPITIGVNIGYAKISLLKSRLVFTGNNLTAIMKDESLKSSTQRTGYIAVVLLRAIRVKYYTFLIGAAMNYNTIGRLKVTTHGDKVKSNDLDMLNRISMPLHFQFSRSPSQIRSAGFFFSYDIRPRFRGEVFNKMTQFNAGLSAALIL